MVPGAGEPFLEASAEGTVVEAEREVEDDVVETQGVKRTNCPLTKPVSSPN